MNFVIAAGGTGGHLFPGLAVGEVLIARGHQVLLITSEKEIDALATQGRTEFQIERIQGVGWQKKSPFGLLQFLLKFRTGLQQVKSLYRKFIPDAVLGMGGFTSTAPILGGRARKIPTFVHESNAIPGKANRLNGRLATEVLLGFAECARFFPKGKSLLTGTPLRSSLLQRLTPELARTTLGLQPDLPTLLVMGGSQGAQGINRAVLQSLPHLHEKPLQIIHLSGRDDEDRLRASYAQANIPAWVASFHHRMEEVYSAASLSIARSGAASLTELAHFGIPSILIPYPHAAEDHQTANAKIFANAAAAILIPESQLTGEILAKIICDQLSHPDALATMAAATARLSFPNAATRVAEAVLQHCP